MNGNTPGLWREHANDAHVIDTETMNCIADVFGPSAEQVRANMRLIAAAPELLEALQELCARRLEKSSSPQEADGSDGRYARARAAIAKATGTES